MKKHLYILVLITHSVFAQNFIPIPLNNQSVMWTYDGAAADGGCVVNYSSTEYVIGDTVINGIIYTKLGHTGPYPTSVNCGAFISNGWIDAVVRQDSTGKVFALEKDSTTEKLLIDFSLNNGDTVHSLLMQDAYLAAPSPYIVYNVDTLIINSIAHRRISIGDASGNPFVLPMQFIEGVGSTSGLLFPCLDFERYMHLSCMTSDTILYSSGFQPCIASTGEKEELSTITFNPNPFSGTVSIKYNGKNTGLVLISDMVGRNVRIFEINQPSTELDFHELRPGIYHYRLITGTSDQSTGRIIRMD